MIRNICRIIIIWLFDWQDEEETVPFENYTAAQDAYVFEVPIEV